jgi:hypothetical protein
MADFPCVRNRRPSNRIDVGLQAPGLQTRGDRDAETGTQRPMRQTGRTFKNWMQRWESDNARRNAL